VTGIYLLHNALI